MAPLHTQSVSMRGLSSSRLPVRVSQRMPISRVAPSRVVRCAVIEKNGIKLYRDDDKEMSKQYRRTVYDFALWANHRSTMRYWKQISTMPSSRIVRSLLPPTLWVVTVSTVVGLYETALSVKALPAVFPHISFASPQPLVLTSFALSLLLVFRTNSSYGRWDEARKMWGGLLNRCRDLMRQGAAFFDDQQGREDLAKWIVATAKSLKCHLREDGDFKADLKDLLTPEELEFMLKADHKPVTAMQVTGEIIRKQNIDSILEAQMIMNLTYFQDVLGGCERILRTPIPLAYTRHTSRFLLIWLTFLPLGMWSQIGWAMIPVNALTALLLLGIEEIGVQIEEPFGILALEVICGRIQSDVFNQVKQVGQIKEYAQSKIASAAAEKGVPQLTASAASTPAPAVTASSNGIANGAANGASVTGTQKLKIGPLVKARLAADDGKALARARQLWEKRLLEQ